MGEERLAELKTKYKSVLDLMTQLGVSLKNLHVQENKLVLRGEAKTKADSFKVWDQIKKVDAKFQADLMAEISFLSDSAPAKPTAPAPSAPAKPAPKIHTVVAGDTLSAIAKKYYGKSGEYMKIFEANKDKLKNPDQIKPGQELVIPD